MEITHSTPRVFGFTRSVVGPKILHFSQGVLWATHGGVCGAPGHHRWHHPTSPLHVDSLNFGGVPCMPPSTQVVQWRGALLLSLFKRGGRSGSEWRRACSRLHVSWRQRPLLVLLSPLVHNHQDQRGNRMKDNGFFPICKNAATKNDNSYSLLSVHFPGMVVGVSLISFNSLNHVK